MNISISRILVHILAIVVVSTVARSLHVPEEHLVNLGYVCGGTVSVILYGVSS